MFSEGFIVTIKFCTQQMNTAEIKGTANDTILILVNENNILNFVEKTIPTQCILALNSLITISVPLKELGTRTSNQL